MRNHLKNKLTLSGLHNLIPRSFRFFFWHLKRSTDKGSKIFSKHFDHNPKTLSKNTRFHAVFCFSVLAREVFHFHSFWGFATKLDAHKTYFIRGRVCKDLSNQKNVCERGREARTRAVIRSCGEKQRQLHEVRLFENESDPQATKQYFKSVLRFSGCIQAKKSSDLSEFGFKMLAEKTCLPSSKHFEKTRWSGDEISLVTFIVCHL